MPTRDAVVVAILTGLLLFVAFNLQAGWVYALVAVLAGLLGVGAVTAVVGSRGIHVVRIAPEEAFEGERITVSLTLRVERWPRLFLRMIDQMPGLEPAALFIPILQPGQARIVSYQTTALRRGEHLGGTVVLQSYGLTGLFRGTQSINAGGRITIFPRYWPLRRFPVPGVERTAVGDVLRRSRSGVEFHGVREYREGDSLRRVHWRSTARRGRLVVREFEDETSGGVTLLLDAGALRGDTAAFEDLVRAAASVAHYVTESGGTVRLIAGQESEVLDAGGGWKETLHALARLVPLGDINPSSVVAAVGLTSARAVVLFTSDADAAQELARRGYPLVAVLAGATPHAELMLRALGIPVCVLDPAEIGASLESAS